MSRIERIGAAICPFEAAPHWSDDERSLAAELARATERGGARRVALELFADLEGGERVSTAGGGPPMNLVIASSVPEGDLPDAVRDQLHGDVNAPGWRRLAAKLDAAGVSVSTQELRRMPLRVEPLEPTGGS